MNQAVINYLFLHREIIRALNVVFCDYPDGYCFVPPNSYLTDRYDLLHAEYLNIESKYHNNIGDEIDRLPLVTLLGFSSLADHFDENIPLWRSLKESLDEDVTFIRAHLHSDAIIPDHLRVIAFELRDALVYHDQKKQKLLAELYNKNTEAGLVIDKNRSVLLINGKKYDIQLQTKPFLFLSALLVKEGVVVSYKELARTLELNAYHEGVTDADIKREVQEVKKSLLLKLRATGVTDKELAYIAKAIKANKGLGYKLDLISR